MIATKNPQLSRRLSTALRPYPKLPVSLCDEVVYRRFRSLEPSLVSCLDDHTGTNKPHVEYFVIGCDGQTAGVLSLVVQENTVRKRTDCLFARVDLVIVVSRFRGLGLAKVLVLSSLVHALDVYGDRLYSMSCLAAHDAIHAILAQLGFTRTDRRGRNFVHEELKLEGRNIDELTDTLLSKAAEAAQATNFRLRQKRTNR